MRGITTAGPALVCGCLGKHGLGQLPLGAREDVNVRRQRGSDRPHACSRSLFHLEYRARPSMLEPTPPFKTNRGERRWNRSLRVATQMRHRTRDDRGCCAFSASCSVTIGL